METVLTLVLIALILFLVLLLTRRFFPGKGRTKDLGVKITSSIENLRTMGELVVFKVVTKEIVTAANHWFGETGKRYFKWLVSAKKMAMIFEFAIDFRYDLRSRDFLIQEESPGCYRLVMPKCFYEIHIEDICFYDEQHARFLPWLLPDLLNSLGTGFDEEDKNRLKEEAREQASQMAKDLVQKMRSEVQRSARQTLEAMARGFGAQRVVVDFKDSELVQLRIEDPADTEQEYTTAS